MMNTFAPLLQKISLAFFVAGFLLSTVAPGRAQKVEIGMTKEALAKAWPAFAKNFKAENAAISASKFPLHGMKGEASFVFANDKLLVFNWEYHLKHKGEFAPEEKKGYNLLLRGLQSDWGRGKVRNSPVDDRIKETTWKLPNARGSIRCLPDMVRVQMTDADYLQRARERARAK